LSLLSIARRLLWSAAAALFAVLLFSFAAIEPVPSPVTAFLVALAVVSAWRTSAGLTIVALLVPIAAWIGRTWDDRPAWPEAVAVAFLLGYAARQALDASGDRTDRLTLAIHATIAVVAASLGVQLLVMQGTIGGAALVQLARELVAGGYFLGFGRFEGLSAAMRLIEGLLLAHAAAFVVRGRVETGRRIIGAVVIGAAVAGAVNVWRIGLGALRLDSPVTAFLRALVTVRFNAHYGDVNAAGSYFVMTLLPALALARKGSRWGWGIAAFLIAVSLILSGSRTAMLAAAIAVGIAWSIGRGVKHPSLLPHRRRLAATIVCLAVIVGAGAVYLTFQRSETSAMVALRVRAELTKMSLKMLGSRPVFGIGTGQYPVRFSEFVTQELKWIYPVSRENAHNNFLQILAELGIVGFAAFVCVVAFGVHSALPLVRAGAARPVERAAWTGGLAFVLTWIAGHPLLLDAPSFSFWLLFGALAGSGAATRAVDAPVTVASQSPRPTLHDGRWLLAALTVVLALSLPVRAQRELAEANLEHLGIGLSQWQTERDGVEYRIGGVRSTVFVPAEATVIEVPVRAVDGQQPLEVEVFLAGRAADVVTVRQGGWDRVVLRIPHHGDRRRFIPLEFRIRNVTTQRDGDLLMIGKVQPRGL
jgi:O-antigen ligase